MWSKMLNPFDSKIYQKALTQGVAHAKGSGLTGFRETLLSLPTRLSTGFRPLSTIVFLFNK